MCLSLGMLAGFGGLTKVTIHPTCANLLQGYAVLATPIQGLIDAGWQATQLIGKQLKYTNSRCPRYTQPHTVEQIKNTSLSDYNSTPPWVTEVARLEDLWLPRWTNWGTSQRNPRKKTKRNNWTQQNPWVSCMLTFIPRAYLHKDISDVIKWCHCHLLLCLGGEKPLHMSSRVVPTQLCICQHSQAISLNPPCTDHHMSFIPQFLYLWHSPSDISVCPCTGVCNLFKKVIIYQNYVQNR